jgi:cobalt-zinc-cadmium efflux system protein
VHDLHVWPIASERLALSAHVRVGNLNDWPQTLKGLREVADKMGIRHVTFQPESVDEVQVIKFIPQ